MDSSAFRSLVTNYVDLHDQLKQASSTLCELRKKKDGLALQILSCMHANNIDECTLSDGKLKCKSSKRTTSLRKEDIIDTLTAYIPAARASALYDSMMSKRPVTINETLLRTKKRV